ncbi:TRAP transporter small permease [Bordetella bronchialis]|uniref:TRAP transporter small permease protein n=1 Tax=Bordetella bronchialis TaxID=463025 RepID=A0A193FC30_9BORD|nr:TRAP transporter small permease [Bordetella bronchialis]ANN65075.1 C4-dicarboxylate ABC transporter permease [Bordetella bronchialis]ANN70106.1 C4-dicarboxylate ABC transporter permease [Bordetella bronchialis]
MQTVSTPGTGRGAMSRALDLVFRIQRWLMVACLVVMVVLLFGNVALRYLFNSGINASDELSRLAFVWLIFIGSVLAVRNHTHMGVTMLVERFGPGARRATHLFCQVLILAVLCMWIKGSWDQTAIGMGTRLPVTGLPSGVFNLACLYAAIVMALLTLADIVLTLGGAEPPLDASAVDPLS